MKVTCESCYFGFDVDDAKIPPSGAQVSCPVCATQFKVEKGGAATAMPTPVAPPAAAKSDGLELSPIELDFGSQEPAAAAAPTPLVPQATVPPKAAPPPVAKPVAKAPTPPAPTPALRATPPRPAAPPKPVAPPPPETSAIDEIDLPGVIEEKPGLPSAKSSIPSRWETAKKPAATTKAPPTAAPPPKTTPPPAATAAPAPTLELDDGPFGPPSTDEPNDAGDEADFGIGLDAPDADDLPTPIDLSRRESAELPAIVAAKPLQPPFMKGANPPAPSAELPLPVDPTRGKPELPVAKAPGVVDLPVARGHSNLPTPKDVDTVVPKAAETNVVPKEVELPLALSASATATAPIEPPTSLDEDDAPFGTPKPTVAKALPPDAAPDDRARPSKKRLLLVASATLGVVLLGGGAFVLFATDVGKTLFAGGAADQEAVIATARKHLAEDTLPSYRRAVSALKLYTEQHGENPQLLGLEAQAHLGAARLGIGAELKASDATFAKLELLKKADAAIEVRHANALRKLVQKQPAEAQTLLKEILAQAPADATALCYLGWTELSAGDATAAAATLKKAVDAEPTKPAALYALGRAKELLGDATEARALYKRAMQRSPQHFRSELGLLRLGPAEGGRTPYTAIEELIQKRLDGTGPRELAEAWATAGLLARDDGQRDVAEDRLRKAVALDPEQAIAQRELARSLLLQRRAKDAIAPAKRAVELEPKSKDARLLLVGVYAESGQANEAQAALQPMLPDGAKLPLVLYYQGRIALLGDKPDSQKALELFNAAIAGDGKLLDAALWKSQTLQKLGRTDEAIAALKAAEASAANDLALTIELGDAYRELNRPIDAEARYRTVLAKTPDDARARMGLAIALEAQEKLDEARAELDKLAKAATKTPGVNERLGRIAKRQGKFDEANRLFDAAMQEGVPTTALKLEAADLALMVKDLDRAQTLAEAVAREDEKSARPHLLLARIHLEKSRFDDALMSARRSAVLGDLPESHFVLGQVLEAMGKYDQAVTEFALARRPPIEQDAALGRARIMARLGATRDALDELQPLTKVPRLRAQAMLLIGDCFADQQQRDKARHAYEEAARADRNSGEAAFKLGRAQADGGKRAAAIDELNRALKLGTEKATWAAEAYLLLGDAYRDSRQAAPALAAYQKYLQLAPPASPSRVEVQRAIKLLGGTP